jgi:hypothetical protein
MNRVRYGAVDMNAGPVVFALVLGWVAGNEQLPPSLVDWLTARETIGQRSVATADCSVLGVDFKLRQVLLDGADVQEAKP